MQFLDEPHFRAAVDCILGAVDQEAAPREKCGDFQRTLGVIAPCLFGAHTIRPIEIVDRTGLGCRPSPCSLVGVVTFRVLYCKFLSPHFTRATYRSHPLHASRNNTSVQCFGDCVHPGVSLDAILLWCLSFHCLAQTLLSLNILTMSCPSHH